MKNIILRLLLVAGIAGLAAGATGAYFSDTISADSNTITSGSLSMTVNGSRIPSALFTASDLAPGGSNGWSTANSGAGGATIKNTGTITGDAWLDIENIKVTGGVNNDKSLADRIQPVIDLNQLPWGELESGKSMNQLNGVKVDLGNIAPGQSTAIYIYDLWPDAGVTLDNLAQGETLNYTVVFHLDQLH